MKTLKEALFSRKNLKTFDPFGENNDQNYVVLFNDENNVERLALIANTQEAIRYVKVSNDMASGKYSFIILFDYDYKYSDCTFKVLYLPDFLKNHDIYKIEIRGYGNLMIFQLLMNPFCQ